MKKSLPPSKESDIPSVPPAKRHPYDQWSPDARALDLVGDKWTLLIVRDLMTGPRRFVELQRVLPGISTEQLRSRLNRMVADGMLTRKRYREVPPRVDYELTERARELAPVIGELARWGFEWVWGAPRPSESIDVTAVFRLLPGLAATAGDEFEAGGTIALTVGEHRGGPAGDGASGAAEHHLLTLDGRRSRIVVVGEPVTADASIAGSATNWVRALGPLGETGLLRTGGRSELVERILGLLALGRGIESLPVTEPQGLPVSESAAS